MTMQSCADCGVTEARHAEIATVLSAGQLNPSTRRRLVDTAILGADPCLETTARSASAWAAVAGVLALAVLGGVWWLREVGTESVASTSIDDQRKANAAYLARPDVQRQMAALPEGIFVAIAGGARLDSDADLITLLRRADQAYPRAQHRFVFRAGTQGDVRYDARFGDAPFLSGALINKVRLGVTGGGEAGKHRFFRLAPGQELSQRMQIPDHHTMVADELVLPLRIGPPGTGVAVRVDAAYRASYEAPIVLRDGLAMPRFEIPGKATLTTLAGERACRRYLVDVSVPELAIHFEPVEAIGNPLPLVAEQGVIEIAGYAFRPGTRPTLQRALQGTKPIVLVEISLWLQRPWLGRVEIGELDRFERLWTAKTIEAGRRTGNPRSASATWTVFDASGRQIASRAVSGETDLDDIRAMLSPR